MSSLRFNVNIYFKQKKKRKESERNGGKEGKAVRKKDDNDSLKNKTINIRIRTMNHFINLIE